MVIGCASLLVPYARVLQFAKFYLFGPACGTADCPLAMSNGAAKLVDEMREEAPWLYDLCFERLTSADPAINVTSGQWMTERTGGR